MQVRVCVCTNVSVRRIAKQLPCVLTVRDVGKVSARLSFQLQSSTTPARDLPSLLSPLLSVPLPPITFPSTSSCSFSYSATEGRLPLANVSFALGSSGTLLTVLPPPHAPIGTPERWMVLVHHSHQMVTDTPESSQSADVAEARGKEREKENKRKREREGGEREGGIG